MSGIFSLFNSDGESDADEHNAAINFDTLHWCLLKFAYIRVTSLVILLYDGWVFNSKL